jgi:hypothetical protein
MKIIAAVLSGLMLIMSGCGEDKSKTSSSESSPAIGPGRTETRGIEASSIVGYDGAGMRRSVDRALNQADARNAEQAKAIEQATGK